MNDIHDALIEFETEWYSKYTESPDVDRGPFQAEYFEAGYKAGAESYINETKKACIEAVREVMDAEPVAIILMIEHAITQAEVK